MRNRVLEHVREAAGAATLLDIRRQARLQLRLAGALVVVTNSRVFEHSNQTCLPPTQQRLLHVCTPCYVCVALCAIPLLSFPPHTAGSLACRYEDYDARKLVDCYLNLREVQASGGWALQHTALPQTPTPPAACTPQRGSRQCTLAEACQGRAPVLGSCGALALLPPLLQLAQPVPSHLTTATPLPAPSLPTGGAGC